jgi:alkylation response protein AidB-like acyl-CoA dehydrogenase
MDFEFSPEQSELRASVRRFLTDHAPLSYVRSQWGDPVGTTDEVWRGLAELGATGLLVPVAHGGSDAGMVTMGVVLEELGRVVHPGPFLSSAVAAPVLLLAMGLGTIDVGPEADLWRGLADGSRRATVVDARAGAGPHWVPDAAAVDTLVVVADDRTAGLVAADDPGVVITPVETVDGSRGFAEVVVDAPLGTGHFGLVPAVDAMLDVRRVAAVVDGVGTAARALELAVAYAGERRQFGRPIGSFQAVQHLCADMLVDLELGRAGAYYALWAIDEWLAGRDPDGRERHRAATMAKAWASDAFFRVGAAAIQVFGGIGYTWEHDIHLFYKRLLTLQHTDGGTTSNLEELAHVLLD